MRYTCTCRLGALKICPISDYFSCVMMWERTGKLLPYLQGAAKKVAP